MKGSRFTTQMENQSSSNFLQKLISKRFLEIWILIKSIKKCALKSSELKQQEKIVCEHGDIDSAEQINQEINDFREKEIILKNFIIIEQNQKAVI